MEVSKCPENYLSAVYPTRYTGSYTGGYTEFEELTTRILYSDADNNLYTHDTLYTHNDTISYGFDTSWYAKRNIALKLSPNESIVKLLCDDYGIINMIMTTLKIYLYRGSNYLSYDYPDGFPMDLLTTDDFQWHTHGNVIKMSNCGVTECIIMKFNATHVITIYKLQSSQDYIITYRNLSDYSYISPIMYFPKPDAQDHTYPSGEAINATDMLLICIKMNTDNTILDAIDVISGNIKMSYTSEVTIPSDAIIYDRGNHSTSLFPNFGWYCRSKNMFINLSINHYFYGTAPILSLNEQRFSGIGPEIQIFNNNEHRTFIIYFGSGTLDYADLSLTSDKLNISLHSYYWGHLSSQSWVSPGGIDDEQHYSISIPRTELPFDIVSLKDLYIYAKNQCSSIDRNFCKSQPKYEQYYGINIVYHDESCNRCTIRYAPKHSPAYSLE